MAGALGIVGLGRRGTQHARVAHAEGNYSDLFLIDIDREKAQRLAEELPGAVAVQECGSLWPRLRALIVSTPTPTHYAMAQEALRHGIPILLEKPPTRTLEELQSLVALAARHHTTLKIGYSERANPFLNPVRSLLRTPPFFLESSRLSPFPGRSLDVDVVQDLMIHDLDVSLYFLQQRPCSVEALGLPVLTPHVDMAKARIKFQDGSEVHLTASRISEKQYRKLRLFSRHLLVTLDFLDKSVEIYSSEKIPSNMISDPSLAQEKKVVVPEASTFQLSPSPPWGENTPSALADTPLQEGNSPALKGWRPQSDGVVMGTAASFPPLYKTTYSFSHVNLLRELHREFFQDIQAGPCPFPEQDLLAFELSQSISQKIQEFHREYAKQGSENRG